jgi:hypothetical protein
VVLTAPRPTRSTPNLPFAGVISRFFTTGNYIIWTCFHFEKAANTRLPWR